MYSRCRWERIVVCNFLEVSFCFQRTLKLHLTKIQCEKLLCLEMKRSYDFFHQLVIRKLRFWDTCMSWFFSPSGFFSQMPLSLINHRKCKCAVSLDIFRTLKKKETYNWRKIIDCNLCFRPFWRMCATKILTAFWNCWTKVERKIVLWWFWKRLKGLSKVLILAKSFAGLKAKINYH